MVDVSRDEAASLRTDRACGISGASASILESGRDWIEFDAMINLRPSEGNRSRDIEQIRGLLDEVGDSARVAVLGVERGYRKEHIDVVLSGTSFVALGRIRLPGRYGLGSA